MRFAIQGFGGMLVSGFGIYGLVVCFNDFDRCDRSNNTVTKLLIRYFLARLRVQVPM